MPDVLPSADTLKYAAAFAFGTLIIFFFANRRIEQLSSFPAGEEFQPLRLLSAEAFAGRRAYRRAFIYYCLLLEMIFIFLCIMQPVAETFVGKPVKDFKFDDVSWPFGAALVVVGLLPATPIFEQMELALRKFAHRAAGIPEGFLTSITLLEHSNLTSGIIDDRDRYTDETERFNKVKNIAVSAGFPISDAQYIARADLFLSVFYGWTLSTQASTIWSANARVPFSDVMNVTSARVIQLREDIGQLVKWCSKSTYLDRLQKEVERPGLEREIDPKLIRDSQVYEDEESRRELFDRWQPKVKEISLTAKQLIAMFVMLAANDHQPNSPDSHFDEAVRLAWREQSRPLYDASVTAVAGGFLAALGAGSIVSSLFELEKGKTIFGAIEEGVYYGSLTAVNLALQFGTALVVAFALYYSRDMPVSARAANSARIARVSGRVSFLLYSALSAATISLIIYVSYQLWRGNLTAEKALNSYDLTRDILFIVGWSFVPGVFALGCTVLADLFAQNRPSWIHPIALILLTTAAAFVLLILGKYEMAMPSFWTSMASVFAISTVSALLFRRYLASDK
jgi:hypothetical protein